MRHWSHYGAKGIRTPDTEERAQQRKDDASKNAAWYTPNGTRLRGPAAYFLPDYTPRLAYTKEGQLVFGVGKDVRRLRDKVPELKKLPEHRFTPVIMLTTEAGEAMKQKGQAIGAKAWVVKPFRPDQLLAAVAKLILP